MPELNRVMMSMAREMEKAGLIDEVVADTLDEWDDDLDEVRLTTLVRPHSRTLGGGRDGEQGARGAQPRPARAGALRQGRQRYSLSLSRSAALTMAVRERVSEAEVEAADEEEAEDALLQARLNSLNQ